MDRVKNKEGAVGRNLIAAAIVIIVVVVILMWGGPAFASLAQSLGFDVSLPGPKDDEAEDIFSEYFIKAVQDCKSNGNSNCYCNLDDFYQKSLPNGYGLIFSDDGDDIKITLKNNLGGHVAERWVTRMEPCIVSSSGSLDPLASVAKDSTVKLSFGSDNELSYESLQGRDIVDTVSYQDFIYKKDSNTLCILRVGSINYAATCS